MDIIEMNLYKAINLELNKNVYCIKDIKMYLKILNFWNFNNYNHGKNVYIFKSKLIYFIVNWQIIIMYINSQVSDA